MGYSFRLAARVLLCASSHTQDNTYHDLCYISRWALAGIKNRVHHEWSIRRPIGPWANSLENELTLLFFIVLLLQTILTHVLVLSRSILLSGPSCSLGYFPFQPVVHNWFIKGRGMYCSVYGKVHIKDPLLLIEKSSLCGASGFPSKKFVNVTIWMTSNNRW